MMRTHMVMILVMTFAELIFAMDPTGCDIYTLNGTFSGESWTPSVVIKPQVTLALKSPTGDPWQEIDIEFISDNGANIGTLQFLKDSTSIKLTLSSWPTNAHIHTQKTESYKSHGKLNNLLQLQDWVYVNITAGRDVRVALEDDKVVFKQVNGRAYRKLYVRVPEEENLQVAFNCGNDKSLAQMAVTMAPEPENSGMKVTIVTLVLLGLLIGVSVFWCIGRKKRNAMINAMEEREKCQDCGDPITEDHNDTSSDEEEEKLMRKLDKCQDCGDVIDVEDSEDKGVETTTSEGKTNLTEDECVCSSDENTE